MSCKATCLGATVKLNQVKNNCQYNNNKISSRHTKVPLENKRQKDNLKSQYIPGVGGNNIERYYLKF